jgi:hypothetical protein
VDSETATRPGIAGLGARIHLFVRPEARERFLALFRDVLECSVAELDFGMGVPIMLVRFGDGSSFSVETSELAPTEAAGEALNDDSALRGAWIEFRSGDPAGYTRRLAEAGIPQFRHPGSNHTYFSAPGGQVFRLLDVSYVGP